MVYLTEGYNQAYIPLAFILWFYSTEHYSGPSTCIYKSVDFDNMTEHKSSEKCCFSWKDSLFLEIKIVFMKRKTCQAVSKWILLLERAGCLTSSSCPARDSIPAVKRSITCDSRPLDACIGYKFWHLFLPSTYILIEKMITICKLKSRQKSEISPSGLGQGIKCLLHWIKWMLVYMQAKIYNQKLYTIFIHPDHYYVAIKFHMKCTKW